MTALPKGEPRVCAPLYRRIPRRCEAVRPYARLPHLHLALALSFRASAHTGVGIRSPRPQERNTLAADCPKGHSAPAGAGYFCPRRQKYPKTPFKPAVWKSLRAFTQYAFRPHFPRERCAMQISPKCCIASAPLSAAAFALKCKAAQFYVSTRKHLQKQRPKASTYLCRFAAKARFDNRPNPRRVFPKREGSQPLPLWSLKDRGFSRGKEDRNFLPP